MTRRGQIRFDFQANPADELEGFMTSSTESFIVPKSYAELQRVYGLHIRKLLTRCNQVDRNFEDLHGYVWMKIMEARLLDRFEDYIARQTPKVLTGIEACDLLGVSWQQWVQAIIAYHTGKRDVWMPTPVNEAEFTLQGISWHSARNALYAFADVVQLTFGERIQGKIHWAFSQWGRETKDGVVVGESRPGGAFRIPQVFPTQSQFKNYLSMAVQNHYANFCRTLMRRHKERPQTPRGFENDQTSWEDTLVEEKQAPAETKVALSEARNLLSETIQDCLLEFGISGGSFQEEAIFKELQAGSTLLQALKTVGLPVRVRKSVIRSLRSNPEDPVEELADE